METIGGLPKKLIENVWKNGDAKTSSQAGQNLNLKRGESSTSLTDR